MKTYVSIEYLCLPEDWMCDENAGSSFTDKPVTSQDVNR